MQRRIRITIRYWHKNNIHSIRLHLSSFIRLQTVVLNMLTSEFFVVENPLSDGAKIEGVYLMNQFAFIYGTKNWFRYDLRGNLLSSHTSPEDTNQWLILSKSFNYFQSPCAQCQSISV